MSSSKNKSNVQNPLDSYKGQIKKLEDDLDHMVEDTFEYEKIINIAIYHLMNGRPDKAFKCLKPYQTVRKYDTAEE